jgi:hypothetical protein
MAENKNNDLPEPSTRQDFPEVKDKVVEIVEVSAEPNYNAITIRFTDGGSLTFTMESCIVTFPVLSEWQDGEEKQLKKYQAILSKLARA